MEHNNIIPDQRAVNREAMNTPARDPLLLAILGTAIVLAALVVGVAIFWGSGPVLAEAPWYIPLISAFVALTTLSIAYLSLGRYEVMRDPLSFWAGTGFAVYGLGQVIYALSWPGLLPGGGSILGDLSNTSAWIALFDLTLLSAFLLAAVLSGWPGKQSLPGKQWLWTVVGALLLTIVFFSLLIRFESYLPVFVDDAGMFLLPMRVWVAVLLLAFAAGSVLSILYYRRSADRLAGCIAFPQMALVFVSLMVLIGGKRYDLWWYLQRVVLVSGYLVVLFGLLSEYIRLLRRESEGRQMLEVLLEHIPVGMAITGGPPHFPLARVSRYGLEMNQRPEEDLTGIPAGQHQAAWRLFLPDGVTRPSAEQMPLYRASRSGEEVRNVELVMEAQDGRKFPVLVNAAPIRDAQGNIVAVINTWQDITDRKRTEEVLRESDAMYRAIARSIPSGGVFVVDRNMRVWIAEGTVAEGLGLSGEMVEGRRVSEIFEPEMAARMEARFQRVFAGETISYETEQNGRIYWTQHALMDGSLGHAIVITLDITERKQAEKALSETEQRFQAIINQATAGIVRSDMEGRFVFVNQAFCHMLGFSESELIGKTIWQITYNDDIEENRRLFYRLFETGRSYQLEKRLLRKDGSIVWVNISASAILNTIGKPQSVVSVVVDISERKRAEEALQQLNLQLEHRVEQRTAELQSANEALSESRKRLQILSQRMVEVQEAERQAIARELHDRVGQTLAALNINLMIMNGQILEDSKQRIGSRLDDSMQLMAEAIALVRDVMTDLRPAVLEDYGLEAALQSYLDAYQSRYEIKAHFERASQPLPRLGPTIEMTLLRIAQEALTNTARHAQTDRVNISLQMADHTVQLRVQDSGVGMNDIEVISPANHHGLKIMRERAEAVGGNLNIESAPGKGTMIEVIIPIGDPRA